MKALLAPALLGAAALAPAPLAANTPTPEALAVMEGVSDFFDALSNDDKTALARQMVPEGMIFIHDRRTPDAPRLAMVPVAKHLENWLTSPDEVAEIMYIESVRVDGDMAQVWGPYYFTIAGGLSHCGINSLSMVKREGRWQVANTSFTMEAPEACADTVAEVNSHFEFAQ